MDQETMRLLITAVGSLLAGLGGATIGFLSAQKVAKRTLEGQRQMATDDALRKWRIEDVRPLLDSITRRYILYEQLGTHQVGAEPLSEGAGLLPQGLEEVERLRGELAATPNWNIYAAPLRYVASGKMQEALAKLQTAENDVFALLVVDPRRGKRVTRNDVARLQQIGERFSEAQAAIHDAAVDYIAQRDDVEHPSQAVRPLGRPWWRFWRT